MQQYMALVWLAVAIVAAVGEAASVALVSIWFAGGAVVALILALFGAPIWAQAVAFFAVSAALLAATRPLAKKYVNARRQATNADRIIGSRAPVTEAVDNQVGLGEVYADGKHWSARSDSGAPIAAGTEVEILRIEGVKVIVRPCAAQTADVR